MCITDKTIQSFAQLGTGFGYIDWSRLIKPIGVFLTHPSVNQQENVIKINISLNSNIFPILFQVRVTKYSYALSVSLTGITVESKT